LIFIGEKQSGKSSLIIRYLDEPLREKMPKTTALDFRSGLKKRGQDEQKVNIYELGGGRILSNMLKAPLNGHNTPNTTVCIVIDLSMPGNSIDNLMYWLNAVREHIQMGIKEANEQNPDNI
jgi:dynein light intermediate chain 2